MGRKLLAVSGGVDSMVLFSLMLAEYLKEEIVVAHFNHGTRVSAADDQEFVRRMCEEVGVEFVTETVELGEGVSEEVARKARYAFLFRKAEEVGAGIYTAHHADDLAESVAINLLRGTGWRGLAVMGDKRVRRPLLTWTRAEILKYAAEHDVRYRFDPTNGEDEYLRNRIREKLVGAGESEADLDQLAERKGELVRLAEKQREIRAEIDTILGGFVTADGTYEREMFRELVALGGVGGSGELAVEVLRFIAQVHGANLTYPQAKDFLDAILNYEPEKSFNLPRGKLVRLHKNYFKMV